MALVCVCLFLFALCCRFMIDIVSTIPYDIVDVLPVSGGVGGLKVLRILKLFKLAKKVIFNPFISFYWHSKSPTKTGIIYYPTNLLQSLQ